MLDAHPRRAGAATSRSSSTTTGCSSTACSSAARPSPTDRAGARVQAGREERDAGARRASSRTQQVGEAIELHAALRHLADPGRAARAGGLARGRGRLGARARPARPAVRQPRGAERRRRRRRWSLRSPRSRSTSRSRRCSPICRRGPAVVVASSGKPVGVLTRADLLEYLARA